MTWESLQQNEEPFLAATFAFFQCLGGLRYIGSREGMPHERFKPVHDFFLKGGLTFAWFISVTLAINVF